MFDLEKVGEKGLHRLPKGHPDSVIGSGTHPRVYGFASTMTPATTQFIADLEASKDVVAIPRPALPSGLSGNGNPAAINENNLVQSDDCILGQCLFASPQIGHAILYH